MACLAERYYVTLLYPRHRLKPFGNIFAPPKSQGTRTLYIKFWAKIPRSSMGYCKLNTRG